MRSVGCAVEYGTQGVVADGNGVKLRLFATNFNHVGSGKDFTNDSTLTVQANEVVETNNGQVSYVSIDSLETLELVMRLLFSKRLVMFLLLLQLTTWKPQDN